MDTNRATNIAKKYESNPSLNMTVVINSCAVNGTSVYDLTSCPQMASFFQCFFTNLYNYNQTVTGYSTSTEVNSQTVISEISDDEFEYVTNMTDILNLTDGTELESVTNVFSDENIEDVTSVTVSDDENVTDTRTDISDIGDVTTEIESS